MTAREILSPGKTVAESRPVRCIEADMPLLEVLPRLLDTPRHEVGVSEDGVSLGVIDQTSLLEGLGRMIAPRDDCSVITIECSPEEYSASSLARAVEDSDTHLVDLLTAPDEEGRLKVTLRVRNSDPTSTVRSLERYDYHVVEAHGAGSTLRDAGVAAERIMALQMLLNV
ncbi:MAG: hypothetical protein HDS35_11575 [Bacteroides sp.]|nr:hypothetical protein [Bacteroides sp.]MBD5281160.1 hypothetical protein [Bacteroides sp.]